MILASVTCQSSPGLAINTSVLVALPEVGMRIVTGVLKMMSCGVNS